MVFILKKELILQLLGSSRNFAEDLRFRGVIESIPLGIKEWKKVWDLKEREIPRAIPSSRKRKSSISSQRFQLRTNHQMHKMVYWRILKTDSKVCLWYLTLNTKEKKADENELNTKCMRKPDIFYVLKMEYVRNFWLKVSFVICICTRSDKCGPFCHLICNSGQKSSNLWSKSVDP